jgi:hypothetical protein
MAMDDWSSLSHAWLIALLLSRLILLYSYSSSRCAPPSTELYFKIPIRGPLEFLKPFILSQNFSPRFSPMVLQLWSLAFWRKAIRTLLLQEMMESKAVPLDTKATQQRMQVFHSQKSPIAMERHNSYTAGNLSRLMVRTLYLHNATGLFTLSLPSTLNTSEVPNLCSGLQIMSRSSSAISKFLILRIKLTKATTQAFDIAFQRPVSHIHVLELSVDSPQFSPPLVKASWSIPIVKT